MRFGIAKSEMGFPLVSALAFAIFVNTNIGFGSA